MPVPINDIDFKRFAELSSLVKEHKDKKCEGNNTRSEISIYTSDTNGLSYVSLEIRGYVPADEIVKILNKDWKKLNKEKGE